MTTAPLPPGLRPGGAADVKSGTERRLYVTSAVQSQELRRLHRQDLARRIHTLGARALFELVDELDRHHGLGDDLDQRLERFAGLDPELLRALGGDRFPPSPMRLVEGRAR